MVELVYAQNDQVMRPPVRSNRTGSGGAKFVPQKPNAAVLIVEDEAVVARDLERSVEDMGYQVVAAVGTGAEALRRAAEQAPELVLMDISLRGQIDGIETAQRLQELYDVPVVYLTAYTDERTLTRAAATLPYGYVVKPFISADVRCAIEVALCRHAAERQLAVASRLSALGTMAAGVAHEINNPLTYVLMNLDRTVETLAGWAEAPAVNQRVGVELNDLGDLRTRIDEVVEGVSRVRQIVADLSLFGRPMDEPLQLVDVREAVAWALRVTASHTRSRGRLVTELEPVPLVRGSDTRVGQVLVNLLMNAAQALSELNGSEQEIRITSVTDPASGEAVITVSDTGAGIAPDALDRIFDPFFTTKAPGSGTGLGLSICHGIVRALSGSLHVRSTLGVGSEFELRLPAAKPVQLVDDSTCATEPRRARILLVDDEPMVLSTLRRALARDYDVETNDSAEGALALLQEDQRFDLILTDLRMPGMSGTELYLECLALDPRLAQRVAFMTGGSPTDAGADPNEWGSPVLTKPFTVQELLSRVQAILAERSADA